MSSRSKLTLLFAVAALAGAAGCASNPPPPPEALATVHCVARAVQAAGDPRELSPHEALALAALVRACLPERDAADAGATSGGR